MHDTTRNYSHAIVARFLKLGLLGLFCLSAAAIAANKPVPKPTNQDCLACHGDSTMTTEVNGKPVSLYVNADTFKTERLDT